jgi:serine/threonine-protein kinase
MGAVYLGTHVGLRKRVAIKVLNPATSTAAMIERFHREAITASQIGHEGIAQVTDLGTSHGGEPFLVMEYLEGESLADRLRTTCPLGVEDACELGCAILSPLAAAHRAGIIHRDLKPDNVFLVRQSRGEMVKLLDFGISRAAGQEPNTGGFRLTTTGIVLGTPYYMSPEQARGESVVTAAADLYSFGVILYEMLIGEVPIRADNYNALMYRVSLGDYIPPRERRPELPQDLEHVIMHAMARTAAGRPASAGDLEQALLPFCRPVFRDHATGRITAPRLPLRTPQRTDAAPAPEASSPGGIAAATVLSGQTLTDGPEDRPTTGPRTVSDFAPTAVRGSRPAAVVEPPEPPELPRLGDASAGASGSSSAMPVPPRRSRTRLAIGAALAMIAIAAVAVFALSGSEPSSSAAAPAAPADRASSVPAASPTAAAMPVAAAAHESASAPAPITIRLAVDPADATTTLDGAPVSGDQVTVPRDSAPHRLRITAAGYVGYDQALRFDESQRLVVALKRTPPPVRARPARKERETPAIESQSPYR